MTPQLITTIEALLRSQWSPDQISGRLRKENGHEFVSYESIYRYIWKDKLNGGCLYKELRYHGKKYNKRGSGKAGRGCIPGRIDISERPAIVEEKSRIGEWEIDTIIEAENKGAVVSRVERHSKLTLLAHVPQKRAEEEQAALTRKLEPVSDHVLTLTADNGKEFTNYLAIASKARSNGLFYSSISFLRKRIE